MTRWVLVELEEELPAYRQVGLFCAFQQLPGVVSVTDLEAISQTTLESYLLPRDQTWEYTQRKGSTSYNAIRNHHKRKRQPPLPLEIEP
jgi:hypothetical protein